MKQNIGKEIKFGLRTSRFLILIVSFMFFAVLTPVMTKVFLPEILMNQFPGLSEAELHTMIDMTQLGAVRAYMSDIFEIGSIIVAFTLCGLMAQEIRENTLVLPLCSGKRFTSIVGAKLMVFGGMLILAPTAALIVTYTYAGLLFSFDIGILPILRGGLLQGLYMVFLLSCLLLWGTILRKPIAAGMVSLATAFSLYFLGGILKIHDYLPSGLLAEAQLLTTSSGTAVLQPLIITVAIILLFTVLSLLRLEKMEWNER